MECSKYAKYRTELTRTLSQLILSSSACVDIIVDVAGTFKHVTS